VVGGALNPLVNLTFGYRRVRQEEAEIQILELSLKTSRKKVASKYWDIGAIFSEKLKRVSTTLFTFNLFFKLISRITSIEQLVQSTVLDN